MLAKAQIKKDKETKIQAVLRIQESPFRALREGQGLASRHG